VLLVLSGAAVPRIFEITGLARMMPCFPGVAEALAHALADARPPGSAAS
jgi:hypothetical protein